MAIRHQIRQGDSVAKLAERYGFSPQTIWDHPENADLKSLRRDMNILAPGDVVYVPDRRDDSRACETGRRHVFRRRAVPMLFRVQLLDGREPRAGLPYVLEVDGARLEGKTDAEGRIERYVPNKARHGRLVVDGGAVDVALDFGHMDPVDTPAGVRKRLVNLGYALDDAADDTGDAAMRAALRLFQQSVGLAPTGDPDDDTRAMLERCHDQPGAYEQARAQAEHAAGAS
jgi:hypothetical protein